MDQPSVVLLATHWTPTFENCRRSLHVFGFDYTVLGWGETWKGWKWRTQMYANYLRTQSYNSLVIFLDAYDAIVSRHLSEFYHTFQAFGRPIVIGCEWWKGSQKNSGLVSDWWKKNNRKPAFRNRVNAGCVVGRAGPLLQMYDWVLENHFEDDQRGIAAWINNYGEKLVALDSGSALIYNGHVFDGLVTSKTAFFQHFPGPLLKLGMMPLYNATLRRSIQNYARCQYPPDYIEALIWLSLFAATMAYILRKS